MIHHRLGKALAVVLAFAIWLGAGYLYFRDLREPAQRVACWATGGFVFFLLAAFLPEYRKLRLLSRQSALRLMALMLFAAAVELIVQHRTTLGDPLVAAALLSSALPCYFVALFLIRGLRTAPQYAPEPETKPEAKAKEAEKEKSLPAAAELEAAHDLKPDPIPLASSPAGAEKEVEASPQPPAAEEAE